MPRDTKKLALEQTTRQYYEDFGRHSLPWRVPEADGSFDPYKILVSEIMLQQTQVTRVLPKYQDFLQYFPTIQSLAAAPLSEVLRAWSGLGYNRRAKFLHQAAQIVVQDADGKFPRTLSKLTKLPGVGKNTAGALLAYAFNQPVVFIETNIRTVYIYHLFAERQAIPDADILEAVAATLPVDADYRSWYWALMDYGSYLKQGNKKLNTLSKTYTKQAKFEGSKRQLRGQVIKQLQIGPRRTAELYDDLPDERLPSVLAELVQEGLIHELEESYSL